MQPPRSQLGAVVPALSEMYPLHDVGEAARLVQTNRHIGKVGVLVPRARVRGSASPTP